MGTSEPSSEHLRETLPEIDCNNFIPLDFPDENPPSNLVMEKQTVDDLFKRLMDVGIITKINQGLSPARAMTPPVVEAQILKEIPVPQIPELPEIMLTLDHLRR